MNEVKPTKNEEKLAKEIISNEYRFSAQIYVPHSRKTKSEYLPSSYWHGYLVVGSKNIIISYTEYMNYTLFRVEVKFLSNNQYPFINRE